MLRSAQMLPKRASRLAGDLRVLMCPPKHFNIAYEINPWMSVEHGTQGVIPQQQWKKLYESVLNCNGSVHLVDPVRGLPDIVFTANAGLVHKGKAFLSRFRYPERQGEYQHYKKWFETMTDYEIVEEPKEYFDAEGVYVGPTFEGAGDGLFIGDVLFAAHGFRSDIEIYDLVKEKMDVKSLVHCELVDPYFYHLDTCFCPINDHQAIWYPKAFSKESQERMKKSADLLEVSEEDAKNFACNAVVLNDKVITPSDCSSTGKLLEKLGFTVFDVPMTEFMKSGGACKCLTLMV